MADGIHWDKVTRIQAEGIKRDIELKMRIANDNSEILAKALRQGIMKALQEVGIQAESDVAKVTPVRTGRLRNSITHQLDPEDTAVNIGTNVEYAPKVEQKSSYLVSTMNRRGKDYREHLKQALENAPGSG